MSCLQVRLVRACRVVRTVAAEYSSMWSVEGVWTVCYIMMKSLRACVGRVDCVRARAVCVGRVFRPCGPSVARVWRGERKVFA